MSRDEILTKGGRAAWKLLAFIAGIVVALAYLADLDAKLAAKAASAVAAPIEKRLDLHLESVKDARATMMDFVREDREAKRQIRRRLDALCRANPRAACPLDED